MNKSPAIPVSAETLISKTPGVCGGSACIRKTRIPVWSLVIWRNGGEGVLCVEPWRFHLCSAEEVVAYNQGFNVEEFLPGYFAIGGPDELPVIRKCDGSPCPIYAVPFMMAESNVVQIAHDFEMFAMALGRNG